MTSNIIISALKFDNDASDYDNNGGYAVRGTSYWLRFKQLWCMLNNRTNSFYCNVVDAFVFLFLFAFVDSHSLVFVHINVLYLVSATFVASAGYHRCYTLRSSITGARPFTAVGERSLQYTSKHMSVFHRR